MVNVGLGVSGRFAPQEALELEGIGGLPLFVEGMSLQTYWEIDPYPIGSGYSIPPCLFPPCRSFLTPLPYNPNIYLVGRVLGLVWGAQP